MSALEFIAAVKWPVTVLVLAAMATVLLKANPRTRQSMGAWFGRRNLRLHVAGQEFEATLAATEGSMGVAAELDSQLAGPRRGESASTQGAEADRLPEDVEGVRRRAVEDVMRSSLMLGWNMAKGGFELPVAGVEWTAEGHPVVRLADGLIPAEEFDTASFDPSMRGYRAMTLEQATALAERLHMASRRPPRRHDEGGAPRV